MTRSQPPLMQQVRNEAELRYGSPLADLLTARRTAHNQYQNDVSTAQDTAHALQIASQQAIPQLAAIYHQADGARKDAQHQIELATGASMAPGNALAVALRGESALAGQRLAGEKAAAQTDTVNRGLDAVAGLAYAKRNALSGYRSTRADLMSQTRDLHSQAGAFAQSRLGELQQAQADQQYKASKDQQQQSNSDRTYNLAVAKARGLDPVTGKPLPGKSPAGVKPLTTEQNNAILNSVQEAQSWVKNLASSAHMNRSDIQGHLVRGDTLVDANKNKLKLPKLPKAVVQAAFDLQDTGYLSGSTLRALRNRGVTVPKGWQPVQAGSPGGLSQTALGTTRKIAGSLRLTP